MAQHRRQKRPSRSQRQVRRQQPPRKPVADLTVRLPERLTEPETAIAHLGPTNSGKTHDALRFLVGLGIGGMWPNGVSLVAEYWSDVSRPFLAGVIGTAANLGVFVMSQLGTFRNVTPDSWRMSMMRMP